MGIQSSDSYIHTWCGKCETLQKVKRVKHYIDKDTITVCLYGCPVCRDIKIEELFH
jgi:hypothetical protein